MFVTLNSKIISNPTSGLARPSRPLAALVNNSRFQGSALCPAQSGSSDGEIAVAGCCFLRDVENSLGLIDFKNKKTVTCSLSEFFEGPQIESLNQFLPCPPLAKESQDLIFQLSVFSCGGLALGGCMSHKLGDGGTASTLFSAWSAISQGSSSCDFETLLPNLAKASLVFPPRNDVPRQLFSLVDDIWFVENNCITKRFVFDAKATETLREKAKGEGDLKPSRTGALSSFLGKRYMATSLALSGSPRPCILRYVVNLRARTEPLLFDGAIGNLFRTVGAVSKPEADLELHELAIIIRESVAKMDHQDFLKSLQGDEGFN
ncbi:hypothetical protein Peur_006563 [Populus x canadensis]